MIRKLKVWKDDGLERHEIEFGEKYLVVGCSRKTKAQVKRFLTSGNYKSVDVYSWFSDTRELKPGDISFIGIEHLAPSFVRIVRRWAGVK